MTTKLLISMLNRGNNGHEILSILDIIAGETMAAESTETAPAGPMPTLDEIPF